MHVRLTYRLLLALAAGVLAVGVAGCGSDNNDNGGTTTQQAQLRFVNAFSPGANTTGQTLTLTSGSNTVFSNSAFGTVQPATLSWMPFTVGQPVPTAANTAAGISSFGFANTPTFVAGTRYTVVAAGQTGSLTNPPTLYYLPDYSPTAMPAIASQLAAGMVAIRVVNLSPTGNSYALVNGTGTTVNTSLGNVVYGVPTVLNSTNNFGYVIVNPNNVSLTGLALQNTGNLGTNVTLAGNLNGFTLQPGTAYTIYIFGQEGSANQPLTAIIVPDWTVGLP